MNRTVTIDGKEYLLTANGSTPRKYRSLFPGKDVFADMMNAVNSDGELRDVEVFENLAYCMALQSGSIPQGKTIEQWLDEMDSPSAIVEIAPQLLEMWVVETKATSQAKKE